MGNRLQTGPTALRRRKLAAAALALALAWVVALACGLNWMMAYEATPGVAATVATGQPENPCITGLSFAPDRYNLVLCLHPRCPCSRASVIELEQLIAQSGDRVATHVLFTRPTGLADEWAHTSLYERVAALPGVRTLIDADGAIAARLGARTSGQVLVYAPGGRLVFAGGITAGRDHTGDNAGASAVLSIISTGSILSPRQTPVYGCELFAPQGAPPTTKETRKWPR
jgi:hypothetical protein